MTAASEGTPQATTRRPAGWIALGCALAVSAALAACGQSVPDSVTPPSLPASSVTSTATAGDADPSGLADSSHANDLYLETPSADIAVSFAWDTGSYSITTDQESTWQGVTGCTSGQPQAQLCQVVAIAGRHASSPVAQWFSAAAPVAMASTGWGESPAPDELNFAFTGTLTINGTPYPVAIGQGSYSMSGTDHNNWWLGGEGWINLGGGTLLTPDRQNYVTSSNNDAVIGIGTGMPPDAPDPGTSS